MRAQPQVRTLVPTLGSKGLQHDQDHDQESAWDLCRQVHLAARLHWRREPMNRTVVISAFCRHRAYGARGGSLRALKPLSAHRPTSVQAVARHGIRPASQASLLRMSLLREHCEQMEGGLHAPKCRPQLKVPPLHLIRLPAEVSPAGKASCERRWRVSRHRRRRCYRSLPRSAGGAFQALRG
jgi:hypothetical protein